MKYVMLILFLALTACNESSQKAAAVVPAPAGADPTPTPSPSATPSNSVAFTAEVYELLIEPSSFDDCPYCMSWCSPDSSAASGWACTEELGTTYIPPEACVNYPLIGQWDLGTSDTSAATYQLVIPGGVGTWNSAGADWGYGTGQAIAIGGSDITFTAQNLTLTVTPYNSSQVVVDYGGGCALLYQTTGER